MNINQNCVDLIKHFEGCRLNAYPDPGTGGAPWTIGYGHTGPEVVPGMSITQDQAEQILTQDLQNFSSKIDGLITATVSDDQAGALLAFAYNVGVGNLAASTLLKLVNQSAFDQVPAQFIRWNKAGGNVLNGLTLRRKSEAHLFATGEVSFDFSEDATVDDYLGLTSVNATPSDDSSDLPPNYGS